MSCSGNACGHVEEGKQGSIANCEDGEGEGGPMAFTATDMVTLPKLTSLAVNKRSAGLAAFTIKTYDREENKAATNIHMHDCNSLQTKQLTRNVVGASGSPVFAVDVAPGIIENQVLYMKDGAIYTLPLQGGESALVARFAVPIESFKIFQYDVDSLGLIVVMDVYADKTPEETKDIDDAKAKETTGVVYDGLIMRHWDNWGTYLKRQHLFLCALKIAPTGLLMAEKGTLTDLLFGMETDCPSKAPGYGEEQYDISPDGKTITFSCRPTDEHGKQVKDMAWSTTTCVYTVDIAEKLSGSAPETVSRYAAVATLNKISTTNAYNSAPLFAPDGKTIAFLSMRKHQCEADKNVITLYNMDTQQTTAATLTEDLSFDSLEWGLESNVLYATAQFQGTNRIFRLTLFMLPTFSLKIEYMRGPETRMCPMMVPYAGPHASAGITEAMYYIESSLTKPPELKLALLSPTDRGLFGDFAEIQKIAQERSPGAAADEPRMTSRFVFEAHVPCPQYSNGDISMQKPVSHYFEGAFPVPLTEASAGPNDKRDLVQCWYVPPSGANAEATTDKSVPLVLIVHGGPQGAIMNNWSYRWNLSFFSSLGYGVAAVNFHGSTGYALKQLIHVCIYRCMYCIVYANTYVSMYICTDVMM
jgi:hypothetical protein